MFNEGASYLDQFPCGCHLILNRLVQEFEFVWLDRPAEPSRNTSRIVDHANSPKTLQMKRRPWEAPNYARLGSCLQVRITKSILRERIRPSF